MRMSSGAIAGAALGSTLLAASSAFAQQAQPATAPPPVKTYTNAGPATGDEAAPGEEKARFRWGIQAQGGRYIYNGSGGGIGGVNARFGAQLDHMFAIYGQPVIMVGAGISETTNTAGGTTSASTSAIAMVGGAVMGDVTLEDLVYLAIGPELMSVGGGSTSVNSNGGGSASAIAGTFFSVAARAGFAFGSMKPERRKAFTIGLDFHAILATGHPILVPTLALGYESF